MHYNKRSDYFAENLQYMLFFETILQVVFFSGTAITGEIPQFLFFW